MSDIQEPLICKFCSHPAHGNGYGSCTGHNKRSWTQYCERCNVPCHANQGKQYTTSKCIKVPAKYSTKHVPVNIEVGNTDGKEYVNGDIIGTDIFVKNGKIYRTEYISNKYLVKKEHMKWVPDGTATCYCTCYNCQKNVCKCSGERYCSSCNSSFCDDLKVISCCPCYKNQCILI